MNDTSSQTQILKSTGMVGSSQLVIILLGIARTKIIAFLIGPIGVGLMGLFQSLVEIIKSVTGLGISFSAVREIAIAKETANVECISRKVLVLRFWSFLTGLLGMLLTIVFSKQLSNITFGNNDHIFEINIISICVLFMAISGGQLAFLQGLGEIKKMSKANVWGVLFGFTLSIPFYIIMGLSGIVPALLITSISSSMASLYFVSKIKILPSKIKVINLFKEGIGMTRIGIVTVFTTLQGAIIIQIIRIFIQSKLNLESVGYFQAAWSLTVVYMMTILNAMATDFYPRLSANHQNDIKINKFTNEQTEISLLLVVPILIGVLNFLPIIVNTLYSTKFTLTISIMQWQVLGTFFKVLSFPLGYLILAKGKGVMYILTDLSFNIPFLSIVFIGWDFFSLQIVGISYLISYIMCFLFVTYLGYRLSKFRFDKTNMLLMFVFGHFCIAAFLNVYLLDGWIKIIVGSFLFLLSMTISLYKLSHIIDLKKIQKKLRNTFVT